MKAGSVTFIALGDDSPNELIGKVRIKFIPYQADLWTVAGYYQAADVYIHAARADTFPNTILESLACGTPVVATAVGGIPEQVKGFNGTGFETSGLNGYSLNEATGILTLQGDAEAMAAGILKILTDDALHRQLSRNAAIDARDRFDLQRQVNDYLEWYDEILNESECKRTVQGELIGAGVSK
jgi:glycosyltransferase involved in cell wall biosynthesis